MNSPKVIAITGGIGAGKSVVSRALRSMGFEVYDCDSEARRLQDSDPEMRRLIAAEVCADAVGTDGRLDRKTLARCVFADPEKLAALNRIVHGAVAADLSQRIGQAASRGVGLFFVETAILYESGFDRLVNEVWEVTAPEEVRIERVCRRNGLTPEEVKARIAAQNRARHNHHHIILNDGKTPVLPQILDELTRRV